MDTRRVPHIRPVRATATDPAPAPDPAELDLLRVGLARMDSIHKLLDQLQARDDSRAELGALRALRDAVLSLDQRVNDKRQPRRHLPAFEWARLAALATAADKEAHRWR
jgi:hypothetical protein